MIVISVAVAKTNFVNGMYDCMVDRDVGKGERVWTCARAIARVFGHELKVHENIRIQITQQFLLTPVKL